MPEAVAQWCQAGACPPPLMSAQRKLLRLLPCKAVETPQPHHFSTFPKNTPSLLRLFLQSQAEPGRASGYPGSLPVENQAAATDRVWNCSCPASLLSQPARSVEVRKQLWGWDLRNTQVCVPGKGPAGVHCASPGTLCQTGCCSHPRTVYPPEISPDCHYVWEVSPQDLFQGFFPNLG